MPVACEANLTFDPDPRVASAIGDWKQSSSKKQQQTDRCEKREPTIDGVCVVLAPGKYQTKTRDAGFGVGT